MRTNSLRLAVEKAEARASGQSTEKIKPSGEGNYPSSVASLSFRHLDEGRVIAGAVDRR